MYVGLSLLSLIALGDDGIYDALLAGVVVLNGATTADCFGAIRTTIKSAISHICPPVVTLSALVVVGLHLFPLLV